MSEYGHAIRALRIVLSGRRNILKIYGMSLKGRKEIKAEIVSIKSAIKKLKGESK